MDFNLLLQNLKKCLMKSNRKLLTSNLKKQATEKDACNLGPNFETGN
jgi:hypothetical protein